MVNASIANPNRREPAKTKSLEHPCPSESQAVWFEYEVVLLVDPPNPSSPARMFMSRTFALGLEP